MLFLAIVLLLSNGLLATGDDYAYTYADSTELNMQNFRSGGQRLVGAVASKNGEDPMVGAYFFDNIRKLKKNTQCTACRISPLYATIAAHCFLDQAALKAADCNGEKRLIHDKRMKVNATFACIRLPGGDQKIWIEDDRMVWFVVFNALNVENYSISRGGTKLDIEYYIRHKHHHYNLPDETRSGGHDLGILKFKAAEKGAQDIPGKYLCLPGPNFQDTLFQARVAGYGHNIRRECVTNSKGPMKHHFCVVSSSSHECHQNSCKPYFKMPMTGDKVYKGCQKTKSPARFSRLCEKVMKVNGGAFREGYDEIHLFQFPGYDRGEGKFLETCYRVNHNDDYGWCRTQGNFHDPKNIPAKGVRRQQIPNIGTDFGWGSCSKECEDEVPIFSAGQGTLRNVADIDVLSDKDCEHLQPERNENTTQKLCVGRIQPLKYQAYYTHHENPLSNVSAWGEVPDRFFRENPHIIKDIYKKNGVDYMGRGYYVTSQGVCNGDSGGPLIQVGELDGRKVDVVIGAVSGGIIRSITQSNVSAAPCGGINNLTGYVRIRQLVDWILGHVKDNVCVSEQVYDFEERAAKRNQYFKDNNMNLTIPVKPSKAGGGGPTNATAKAETVNHTTPPKKNQTTTGPKKGIDAQKEFQEPKSKSYLTGNL